MLLLVTVAALAMSAASASAWWGKEGLCGRGGTEENHCYAISEWKAAGHIPAGKHIYGQVDEMATTTMSIPGWEAGDFVTNEGWTLFPKETWLETGQIGGPKGTGNVHPFIAEYVENKERYYYEYPSAVSLGTFHNYWMADVNGKGLWCVYWFWGTFQEGYEHGPVHCGEFAVYATAVQAGEEAGAETEPAAGGLDIVSSAWNSPFVAWKPWYYDENYFGPNGMCGSNDSYWSSYPGSINYGAGFYVCGHYSRIARRSATSASTEPQGPQLLEDYVAPTGSELSPEDVQAIALKRASFASSHAPTNVTMAHGNFGAAQAVVYPRAQMPANKQTEAFLSSSTDVVEMHGSFTAYGSHPRGTKVLKATVLALVIDSHTGAVEVEYLGERAPVLTELGTVVPLSGSSKAAAATAGRPAIRGRIVGHLYEGGGPLHHARSRPAGGFSIVVAANGTGILPTTNIIARTKTSKDGSFVIKIGAGNYRIAGQRRDGRLCGSVVVSVKFDRQTNVNLGCARI
jgi:hypothetical protein